MCSIRIDITNQHSSETLEVSKELNNNYINRLCDLQNKSRVRKANTDGHVGRNIHKNKVEEESSKKMSKRFKIISIITYKRYRKSPNVVNVYAV